MDTEQATPDETQALRRCVRELAALSTLSAVWSRKDVREVAEGLCRVLCRSLPAALTYVRVTGHRGAPAIEAGATPRGPTSADQTQELGRALAPLLNADRPGPAPAIANPFGAGRLRLAVAPLGYEGDCGALVAGSQQPDFPSQTDRLLLGVAANQAAIVLQQKRSEEQVRRSERELADFFDNATVGMHWAGPDGIILRANRAELGLLGYSPDEYVGRHVAEFHADKGVIEDVLRRLWAGENVSGCEARLRCKDGSVKHVLIDSSVLWEGGRFVHTRTFTRDVTERKLAEETRLRLAAIVESSDDAIVSKDLNGIIRSWNRGAELIFGYTAPEAIGQPVTMLMPPERVDEEPGILERVRRGEKIEHYETIRRRKDGTLLNISLSVSPVFDARGTIIGASKIARDVTRRKQAERRLQRGIL